MKTPLLFLTAIATPIALAVTALLPIYGSILGACYLLYTPESGPHPMADKLLNVFYVADTYSNLLQYWSGHAGTLGFVEYTLPILGLPLLGSAVALWLTYKLARYLINFFQLSATIH